MYADGVYAAVRTSGPAFAAELTDAADARVRDLGLPETATTGCSEVQYVSSTEVLLDCWIGTLPDIQFVLYRIDPRTLAYR